MALFKPPPVIEALEDLLDRERLAILSGNLDALARHLAEKTRLLEALAKSTSTGARIEQLKVKANRNQELLVAVGCGIKSATRRLKELNNPKMTLRTYDKGGASTEIFARKPGLEKRA